MLARRGAECSGLREKGAGTAGNLGEFFKPVLSRGFDADGEFCGFSLAHIDWVYCTISARRGSADAEPCCLLEALAAAVNKEKREPART